MEREDKYNRRDNGRNHAITTNGVDDEQFQAG
jgi:hypothetical protein